MFPSLFALLPYLGLVHGLARPNNVGRLPALGWNSWNAYHCDITEDKFMSAANDIISKGFKDVGYTYVNIDDCWSNYTGRDPATKRLVPDPTKFPDGISGLAAKIHAMGLKIGIYSSAGSVTCAGYPASIYYEDIDAATFADWGIDFLKYDNCGAPANWTDTCTSCATDFSQGPFVNGTCVNTAGHCPANYDYRNSNTYARFDRMASALNAQSRTILYALCEWGTQEPWAWAASQGSSWRTTNDISPDWEHIARILNQNSFVLNYGDFNAHNDPDMLEVGNGNLTDAECRSHFALWALMKSPLIIGTDLSQLSDANTKVLQNQYLLAFNQDEDIGHSAAPYKWGVNPDWTFNATNPAEFWAGCYKDGMLVGLLNTLDSARSMKLDFGEIPGLAKGSKYEVVDVWSGESKGCVSESMDVQVQSHDTAVYQLKEGCGYSINKEEWQTKASSGKRR